MEKKKKEEATADSVWNVEAGGGNNRKTKLGEERWDHGRKSEMGGGRGKEKLEVRKEYQVF